MPARDLFGVRDVVKLLTAPAPMAAVHRDGFSWAKSGLSYQETTKLTSDDWNVIIGNFRSMLIASGMDLDTLDPDSPHLLRDVVLGFIAAKIVAEFPGLFTANKEVFAAELADVPAFVAAIIGALPTNLVDKAGDTMTGPLTLPGNPAAALHAAPKQYVDAAIAALVASSPAALDTLNELAAALGDDANFAVTVNAALATRALASRTISGGGLATGGGDMTANRTITVAKSTNAQAIAGTDDATAMTPVRTKDAIGIFGLGGNQTWQDMSASRTQGTSYQNTSGKPKAAFIQGNSSSSLPQISANNSTWLTMGQGAGGAIQGMGFLIVPHTWHYRCSGTGAPTIWQELG